MTKKSAPAVHKVSLRSGPSAQDYREPAVPCPASRAALETALRREQEEIQRLTLQVGQLEQALALERAEADLCRRSLEAILLISEATSDSLITSQLFDSIADSLLDITGFGWLSVHLHEPENKRYRLVAARGLPAETAARLKTLPANRGDVASIVAETKQPVFTSDHASDPRAVAKILDDVGVRSVALIPLLVGKQYFGFFALSSPEALPWDETQLRFLASLGRQIGLIVYHAHLANKMRSSAAIEERLRLGRELHDSVAQTLGFLNLQMTITNTLLSQGQVEEAQAQFREMKKLAGETYEDVSEAIVSLHTSYSQGEFLPTLQEFLADYRAHTDVVVQLTIDDRACLQFSPDVSVQLVRIVQEALTNVRKHASASQAWIRFEPGGDHTQVIVQDDGDGFDSAQTTAKDQRQFGLRIMRERAESVGGSLEVDAQLGRGSQILIRMPVIAQG